MNSLDLQDYKSPPQEVGGCPTTVRLGEVVTLNDNQTLDIRAVLGRGGGVQVPYPNSYVPQIGDRVLYGDLHGDPRTPVLIAPISFEFVIDGGFA